MITIGMPSYNNAEQVWFTVEALRLYQDIEGCEILVLDNQGNSEVKKVCTDTKVRYELYNEVNGTGPARNKIFEIADHPFVLIMDSHVLLYPESIKLLKWWLANNWKQAANLIHGPLVLSGLTNAYTHYENAWRADMWGIWPNAVRPETLGNDPIEIEMMGCGLFGCRKDSWLGFNKDCKGFDGVEGVIHAKYRKAGRKVICLPFLKWVHKFGGVKAGYPLSKEDKIRNFLLGFAEIGMDPKPIYDHFGYEKVSEIERTIRP
jgi:glycosyltransferase involved in cell wall biosynthesis